MTVRNLLQNNTKLMKETNFASQKFVLTEGLLAEAPCATDIHAWDFGSNRQVTILCYGLARVIIIHHSV